MFHNASFEDITTHIVFTHPPSLCFITSGIFLTERGGEEQGELFYPINSEK